MLGHWLFELIMNAKIESNSERLQVVLARFGIASRRGVVALIEEGKVAVNGQIVYEKGFYNPNCNRPFAYRPDRPAPMG